MRRGLRNVGWLGQDRLGRESIKCGVQQSKQAKLGCTSFPPLLVSFVCTSSLDRTEPVRLLAIEYLNKSCRKLMAWTCS